MDVFEKKFAHIYVEKGLDCQQITRHFKDARLIEIDHYKDVFNRIHQDFEHQHRSQNLILAKKKGQLIYKGAPVCQDFDNKWFFYTSQIMNCLYDCEYCYLKGMYPSGNMVMFLNIEDYFREAEEMLKKHPIYLCISYDTDLLAVEAISGFVKKWCEFTLSHPGMTIEVRTKAGNADIINGMPLNERTIFAFTLSPESFIQRFEKGSASLKERLNFMKRAMERGASVRACFDPMIRTSDWKDQYEDLLDTFFREIDPSSIRDASVGTFRISGAYLKPMRQSMPKSLIAQYPYVLKDGYYQYSDDIKDEMESFLEARLTEKLGKNRIFRWEENDG